MEIIISLFFQKFLINRILYLIQCIFPVITFLLINMIFYSFPFFINMIFLSSVFVINTIFIIGIFLFNMIFHIPLFLINMICCFNSSQYAYHYCLLGLFVYQLILYFHFYFFITAISPQLMPHRW